MGDLLYMGVICIGCSRGGSVQFVMIADRRGFIARMGPEVNIARNEVGQVDALIAGLAKIQRMLGRRGDCGEAEAVEVKEEDGLGFV
ncbi:hypothetical protein Tco_0558660 [Tanacetum coccineum]